MNTVQMWWQKLVPPEPVAPAPKARSAIPRQRRPVPFRTPDAPELELSVAPEPSKPSHVGAAGFDPYASDAGYSKPHSWERIDHD